MLTTCNSKCPVTCLVKAFTCKKKQLVFGVLIRLVLSLHFFILSIFLMSCAAHHYHQLDAGHCWAQVSPDGCHFVGSSACHIHSHQFCNRRTVDTQFGGRWFSPLWRLVAIPLTCNLPDKNGEEFLENLESSEPTLDQCGGLHSLPVEPCPAMEEWIMG